MSSTTTRSSVLAFVVLSLLVLLSLPGAAGDEATVTGTFTANGTSVELPYVYVYKLDKGFYDDNDPAWTLLFVDHPIEERKLDEHIWDGAYVELKITRTAEFDDKPTLQVYAQNLKLSPDAAGNLSGGTYPELELESAGPDRFAGRVYLPEMEEFFDDTFQYDFTFSAPLSDPNAPLGEMLPADGGEPGKAYLAWVAAVHSGDLERFRKLVPEEMMTQLDDEEAKENLAMMQAFTPTDVTILSGSSDGQTAILQVEGTMDGETAKGEITLEKMAGKWMATGSAW